MATQVTNYQCLNCSGPLHFDNKIQKLKCDHCETEYDVDVIEQVYKDKEEEAAAAKTDPNWDATLSGAGSAWSDEEASHMKAYSCPSCSAQIICDDTTAATSCPYCDNPTIVPGQFADNLRPDYVIPFKLDKNAAVEALKKYYQKKKFLPKSFADSNHIEEIKGVYVPFWLFDGEADATMRFRGTNIQVFVRGDVEITTTEHYRVVREGHVKFEKVPADGSSKMPDAHMDSIEPFRYEDLKDFSTAYLPGFLADKYDLDAKACVDRANGRIKTSATSAIMSTISGYTSLTPEYQNIQLAHGDVHYALLPVWMLSTKWKNQNFLFAMNGQTGRLIGDLPVDWGKFFLWFFGISIPLMILFGIIAFGIM
jgi:DNA-directed RNA polymerase subunit RPC12/RpoP